VSNSNIYSNPCRLNPGICSSAFVVQETIFSEGFAVSSDRTFPTGYSFSSGPPLDRIFTMLEVAEVLNSLMFELGFGETGNVSQGGEIGSRLSRLLGAKHKECKAVHCQSHHPACAILPMLDSDLLSK
jgi:hypothetical protein